MNVLITRPKRQAENLAKTLRQQSINSICFPVIEIVVPNDLVPLQSIASQLSHLDALIFVSPSAAKMFLQYVKAIKITQPVFTMGKGTAVILENAAINVFAYPSEANSENLLALPQLQKVTGKKMAIFAGEAGNTWLENTLIERGANVKIVYTHRRCIPKYTLPLSWRPEAVDMSICTSLVGLHNFHTMLDRYKLFVLLTKPILVITTAMQMAARQLGFKSAIILAKGASDAEIIAALQSYSLGEK